MVASARLSCPKEPERGPATLHHSALIIHHSLRP
jgi:hypothetical protein